MAVHRDAHTDRTTHIAVDENNADVHRRTRIRNQCKRAVKSSIKSRFDQISKTAMTTQDP
jgi:hypothetical protein